MNTSKIGARKLNCFLLFLIQLLKTSNLSTYLPLPCSRSYVQNYKALYIKKKNKRERKKEQNSFKKYICFIRVSVVIYDFSKINQFKRLKKKQVEPRTSITRLNKSVHHKIITGFYL